jgi:uncharacterized protein (DUF2062 family)
MPRSNVCSCAAMTEDPPAPAQPNWWQRRLAGPVRQQLTQGITPDKIALTLALGFTLGIFPILGSGFLLCGLAAWALKLNQPIIQGTGTLAYPLQLVFLLPFYRAGESLFKAPPVPLSIPVLLSRFFEDVPLFLKEYGMTGLRGIIVWCLMAPWVLAALYFSLRPLLRRLAARLVAQK